MVDSRRRPPTRMTFVSTERRSSRAKGRKYASGSPSRCSRCSEQVLGRSAAADGDVGADRGADVVAHEVRRDLDPVEPGRDERAARRAPPPASRGRRARRPCPSTRASSSDRTRAGRTSRTARTTASGNRSRRLARAAPRVRAAVGERRPELADEIAVGAVEVHAVEAGLDRAAGGRRRTPRSPRRSPPPRRPRPAGPVITFGTAEGASGSLPGTIDWLPAWAIWAKIRPPRGGRRPSPGAGRDQAVVVDAGLQHPVAPAGVHEHVPGEGHADAAAGERPVQRRRSRRRPRRRGPPIDSPVPARMTRLRTSTGPSRAGSSSTLMAAGARCAPARSSIDEVGRARARRR